MTRLVFLDETGTRTDMARTHARSRRGTRAVAAVPRGHYKAVTVIGAVALGRGVVAAASVDAAADGETFARFAADALCPALRPGDVVVMDNLAAHKRPAVAALVAAAAAGATVLYLPAYSPDFNPIEQVWSKVKRLLRTAAARTIATLGEAIRWALAQVTLDDLAGCVADCGYQPAT